MNRTPIRKRKREFKKFLSRGLVVLVILSLLGGGIYYLSLKTHKKSSYVSPLSMKALNVDNDDPISMLKKNLKQKNIEFTDVKIISATNAAETNSGYLVKLKEGGVVTFSSEKDMAAQISSLQFITARLTMEGKLFTQLDLRFDKPVIVLTK